MFYSIWENNCYSFIALSNWQSRNYPVFVVKASHANKQNEWKSQMVCLILQEPQLKLNCESGLTLYPRWSIIGASESIDSKVIARKNTETQKDRSGVWGARPVSHRNWAAVRLTPRPPRPGTLSPAFSWDRALRTRHPGGNLQDTHFSKDKEQREMQSNARRGS